MSLLATAESEGGIVTETDIRTNQSELAGEIPFLSLRQIAPAGFLTQAFALDWSVGCQS